MLWMRVVSSASLNDNGGRIEGIRLASAEDTNGTNL